MKRLLLFPRFLLLVSGIIVLLTGSCVSYQQITYENSQLRVQDTLAEDTALLRIISPYKNALSAEMNEEIGTLKSDLYKAKPESGLTNLVADILFSQGNKLYNNNIDFAVYNYGGVRIDNLPQGSITKEKIFELLPFENFATVVTLDGQSTARLIQKIVDEGGWPVSGIRFVIKEKKAGNIFIGDAPFDSTRSYHIIMNDYMANGGDNLDFLPGHPAEVLGITVRDMVIEFFRKEKNAGRMVSAQSDGRISYAQ